MTLLDPVRFQSGWGVGCFGNWGASDEAPQYIQPTLDHGVIGLRRLIAQYQDDPIMVAFLRVLLSQFQALEAAGQAVFQLRSLDTGFGVSLDGLGDLLQILREGAADNTYRIRLAGKVLANTSDTTPEVVRAVLDFLMQGLNPVRFTEAPPAITLLKTFELPQSDGFAFARIVAKAIAIGTRVIIEYEQPGYEGASFGWENDNSALGWAEFGSDPGPGGLWAEGSDGGVTQP